MKFLDSGDGTAWLSTRGWPELTPDPATLERLPLGACYLIPESTSRKTALATLIVGILDAFEGKGVLWISRFSVWEAENWNLFNGFRKSLGEDRPLDEAPFHVFGRDDYASLESLIDLVLYFFWDAILLDAENGIGFHFSHDEWIAAAASDPEAFAEICRRLEQFHLSRSP